MQDFQNNRENPFVLNPVYWISLEKQNVSYYTVDSVYSSICYILAIRNNCSVYNSIVIAKKTKATVRSSGFLHHISLSKSVEVDLTPLMNTCWFRNSYILQALLSLHISSFMQRNNKGKILVVCRLSYVSNTKTNAPRYALCVEGSISGMEKNINSVGNVILHISMCHAWDSKIYWNFLQH